MSNSSPNVGSLLLSASFGALGAYFYLTLSSRGNGKKTVAGEERLGPPPADIRYPLTLHGAVDRLYDGDAVDAPYPFEFTEKVVEVFDDMVSRSVPFYSEAIDFLIYMVARYYKKGTKIIDLGCSTGTTLDAIVKGCASSCGKLLLEGVDEAPYMIEECKNKMAWAAKDHQVDIIQENICKYTLGNASIIILNYTLQFIDYQDREALLLRIYNGLNENGVLFLSEKIEQSDNDMQDTCVWAYEDFKYRRGYSREYIEKKKDALTNVLRPYTEAQLVSVLETLGFDHVQTCVKWNCFVSIIARKRGTPVKRNDTFNTPEMDKLFPHQPMYLKSLYTETQAGDDAKSETQQLVSTGNSNKKAPRNNNNKSSKKSNQSLDTVEETAGLRRNYDSICTLRRDTFYEKGKLSAQTLESYESIAAHFQQHIRRYASSSLRVVDNVIQMGHRGDLSDEEYNALQWCAEQLRPWRKGPWNLFGLEIDAEWRSDQKWDRLMPNLPSMEGKVLCDLGCGNGYFMLRMLEHNPKLVVGIDPNMHAWLEFQMFSYLHKTIEERVKFEILRGENIDLFENTFDVVFCLGVLYHTPDPIGVLRNIKKSMKRKGSIIVDCQGVEGEEPYALFPKRKYANMKGVYFLPTITTVQYWLSRSGFLNASVFFAEELSTNEQRATDWAPISSLEQALQKDDDIVKTVEGYPRPWRFYLKADV